MSVHQVANYVGLSKATVYKYASDRTLPHVKIGSRLLFRRSEIASWIDERSVEVIGSKGL